MTHAQRIVGWVLALSLLVACQGGKSDTAEVSQELAVAVGSAASSDVTLGPVSATLTISNSEPLIGDLMTLELVVEAAEGVSLQMPGKAEAFSRFTVEKYSDGRESTKTGNKHTQKYVLQASRSGRLRIPPLRIAFVDKGPDSKSGDEQELLTEEIPIKVRPVLAGDEASKAQLRPIRGSLQEELGNSYFAQYWWIGALSIAGLAVLIGLFFLKRSKREQDVSPYEKASVALASLESQGMPDTETLDNWYVQLSSIVREYLEGRFALRAPELTTEEFLREAQRSDRLSDEHKALVSGFLADCDRVKFAGYEPEADESRAVLEAARRFLLETRESEAPDTDSGPGSDTDSGIDSEEEAA